MEGLKCKNEKSVEKWVLFEGQTSIDLRPNLVSIEGEQTVEREREKMERRKEKKKRKRRRGGEEEKPRKRYGTLYRFVWN